MSQGPQVSTNVVGFFNSQKWPIVVNISTVNVNMLIQPGDYVTLRDGRKVNDPILESYTGPGMLSKQTSKLGVPAVMFPRPPPITVDASAPAVATGQVVKDSRGIGRLPETPAISQPSASSAIKVYTVDQAVKEGVIEKPAEKELFKEIKENLPPPPPPPKPAAKVDEKALQRIKAGQPLPEPAPPAPTLDLEAEMNKLMDSLGVSADSESLGELAKADESKEELVKADEIKEDAKPPTPTPAIPKGFVCEADGKKFPTKTKLKNYIKKHYPDRLDELMASYR